MVACPRETNRKLKLNERGMVNVLRTFTYIARSGFLNRNPIGRKELRTKLYRSLNRSNKRPSLCVALISSVPSSTEYVPVSTQSCNASLIGGGERDRCGLGLPATTGSLDSPLLLLLGDIQPGPGSPRLKRCLDGAEGL
jgi:hypothetical protein